MKIIFEFFIIAALTLWLSGEASAQSTIRVVVYGDSLTSGYQLQPGEGFADRLDQKFRAVGFTNVQVINMSVAGETTAGGLTRINSLLDQHPDIVVLELGTNDAKQGISIEIINNNLGNIVGKLVQNKIYTILIGNKAPSSMGYAYDERFEAIYGQLAKTFNLPFYPFILQGIIGSQDLNLADGYHPSAKGVLAMVEQIYPLVDAGVRWKWETQQQYQQWLMQQNQGVPAQPAAQQ